MIFFVINLPYQCLVYIVNSDEFDAGRKDTKPIDNRRVTSNDSRKFISINYSINQRIIHHGNYLILLGYLRNHRDHLTYS